MVLLKIWNSLFCENKITDLSFISPLDSINSITATIISVVGTLFQNNTSGKEGTLSLVDCNPGWIVIENNTFYSNSATEGAGLYFGESSVFIFISILNCIFQKNYAENNGGAVFFSPFSTFNLIQIDSCLFGKKRIRVSLKE